MKNIHVSNMRQFQKRSEELERNGYVAVKPSDFLAAHIGDRSALSWGDYIHSKVAGTNNTYGMLSGRKFSNLLSVSGGENIAKPNGIGTKGLGFMSWGLDNRLPNIIWLLSRMSPFTSSGIDFIKKLLVGRGPRARYHYTQYIGGNIVEKNIAYKNAGVLLRGQISDLRKKEDAQRQEGQTLNENFEDSNEMKLLKKALADWERTNEELESFLSNNDLMDTYSSLAGDMALMSQCFVELQLNQRQLGDDGKPVPITQWVPRIIGIKPRSIFTTRLERMDENYKINYAYISNQWLDPSQQQSTSATGDKIAAVPFLPSATAVKDLHRKIRDARLEKVSRKNRPTRFIMSPRDFGGPYYANALWHSIFAGSIFEYAFTIIEDRLTRKRNSNIIGRVIYIHQDYLQTLYRQQPDGEKQKTIAQIQREVFNDINDWLSNSDNAGQALISSVFMGPDGKEHKAWEVVEIESKAKDQATADKTELQEISSIIFFAMGLDSKLIGNTPGDATSSGGTDLRERFLVKQIQFSPLQQLMLRPLDVISRYNEWDEHLVWEIEREVLTTLDNSKTGVTTQE